MELDHNAIKIGFTTLLIELFNNFINSSTFYLRFEKWVNRLIYESSTYSMVALDIWRHYFYKPRVTYFHFQVIIWIKIGLPRTNFVTRTNSFPWPRARTRIRTRVDDQRCRNKCFPNRSRFSPRKRARFSVSSKLNFSFMFIQFQNL